MNNIKIIQYIILAFISLGLTSVLTTYLNKINPRQIEKQNILEMPKLYLILSNALFIAFVFIEFMVFFDSSKIVLLEKLIYGVFGLFMCFGAVNTLLLYLRHKVIYDNEFIEETNWLGKTEKIKWQDIEIIYFSPISSSLKIKTENITISIHEHIKGYKTILSEIENRTNLRL